MSQPARAPRPAAAPAGTGVQIEPVPMDFASPQLTVRAVLTGMVLGGTLSLCNIYAGLKIGWGFNMSITAMLLAFGFWKLPELLGARPFGMLENNINQTAASAAASVSSAGLVSAIPALTLLTGEQFTFWVLASWVFAVSAVGVVVAVGIRRQMIEVDRLPFPSGIASATTIKEMYARGREAMQRVLMLVGGGIGASIIKILVSVFRVPQAALPGSLPAKGALAQAGFSSIGLKNLTFVLDPSLLMVAVGGIIGIRPTISMLLGAVVGWGILAPYALAQGWASPGNPDAGWFGSIVTWTLWPGVGMMVVSSLTSFAFSVPSLVRAFRGVGGKREEVGTDRGDVPRNLFLGALLLSFVVSVVLQTLFFDIGIFLAAAGVLLTFVLAVVAGRVSGETGITPVGPMGKVTQLLFGVLAPGQAAPNLMAANVTAGAASQCADLLHDLKTGQLIGAVPRQQAVGQTFGVLAGALVGSLGYLIIVRDPSMLMTDEWPAPAVAQWKAVAEIFMKGIEAMPPGALVALGIGSAAGFVLALLEKLVPAKFKVWVPSPASVGLAIVIPAYNSISMFLGALLGLFATKVAPNWTARFLIVLAAGIIAGESLTGVGLAVQKILAGG